MNSVSVCRLSRWVYLILTLSAIFLTHDSSLAAVKDVPALGDQPTAVDINGKVISLYKASYALLISNGNYTNGWPKLEHAATELDQLATVLQRQGFTVRRVSDANHDQLRAALREFVFGLAKEPDSRSIIFFSGHGYTNKSGLGYLVPTDAPDPDKDSSAFFARAMPINELDLLAREASSRHMLFIFDSCFSGSVFSTKGLETRPDPTIQILSERQPYFLGAGQQPVRQFLAAGGAKERVPAESVFIPLLTKALSGNVTIASDGYLTGKELGLWLEQTLPGMSADRNHPHSDVLPNPDYAFGDMVFQIKPRTQAGSQTAASSQPRDRRYRAIIRQESSDLELAGTYEVTYWREQNDLHAEVVGTVGINSAVNRESEVICSIDIAVSRFSTAPVWTVVAYSSRQPLMILVRKGEPRTAIGPLHLIFKDPPSFEPDKAWFTLFHYVLASDTSCTGRSNIPMQQVGAGVGAGLFLPQDLIATKTSTKPSGY